MGLDPGPHGRGPLGHPVGGDSGDRRRPARQGRPNADHALRHRGRHRGRLGQPTPVAPLRPRRGPSLRARPRRALGARRRAGAVARGPLPRGQPPARRRTQRREARGRDRPRPHLPRSPLPRPRRRRQHLVVRGPRRLGEAHRRCLQGPARRRPAVDRDHRQRGGPSPCGAGSRASSAGAGAAARHPVAALPLPHPLPPLRRGVARSSRCCPSVPPSTTRGTASTVCAT